MSKSLLNRIFPTEKNHKLYCHFEEADASFKLANEFSQLLQEFNPNLSRPVIIIGIGTDRSTGDCLGPLVGTKLLNLRLKNLEVFGTLDNPVHASNMKERIQLIEQNYKNPLTVAVDASLGKVSSIGNITLSRGALEPGKGVKKDLPKIGDIHFTGIINSGGYMEYLVLQNTRLSLVMKIADKIALSIYQGYNDAYSQYFKTAK